MTLVPTPVEEIDAYEEQKAALAARAKTRAGQVAKAGGQKAKTGTGATLRRLGRGLKGAPGDVMRYLMDPDAQDNVDAAPDGDPTTKARIEHRQSRRERRANAATFAGLSWAWLTGGSWAVTGWVHAHPILGHQVLGYAAFAALLLVLTAAAVVSTLAAHGGKTKDGYAWPARLWLILAGQAAGLFVHLAAGVSLGWLRLSWTALVVAFTTWAASDGDLLGDGNQAMAPENPGMEDATEGAVIRAVNASDARLAKDTELSVVAPGVMPLAGGKMWTVTLDTGGPDAGPIVAARNDVASRLSLSGPRLMIEQSKDLGRRVRLTGIVESPWGEPTRSPLVDAERWRFGDPLPYAIEMVTQQEWMLPLFEMHYLIGGQMRRGKSTSCYPVYAAAALDPLAPIWIIDGGDVDTRPWHDAGVARRWTTDPEEAAEVLDEVSAEIDERQDLLGQEKLIRPTPEFYDKHQMSDGLLGFDEFAGFTNHPDRKLAGKISRKLVSIIQRAPKTNIHVMLSAQSPSAKAFDTDGRGVINGRAALLCDGPEMSDKIMGSGSAARGIDASTLDETVKGLQWMSIPGFTGIVRPHLITPEQVRQIAARAARMRGRGQDESAGKAEAPRVLVEMQRLLSDPSRRGRMLSAEVAAAMKAYGIVEVTPADRVGAKTDEQIAQEKLAALVAPFGVRPRPDRDAGNRMAYWLAKEHRDTGEVGVTAAIARIESGRPVGLRGVSGRASEASPAGSPGRRGLRVV